MKSKATKVVVIAEAGVNHNGDIGMARRLIEEAAAAGADLIKFQTFVTKKNIGIGAPKAAYQIAGAEDPHETQYEMIKKLELSRRDHEILVDHCRENNVGFFSTGFDVPSVDLLVELGLNCLKIPSGEITNLPLLRHIGAKRKAVLLSTGMATMGDIEAAIEVLEVEGVARSQITVLHCTTEYPTPMHEVNLRAMCAIGEAFGVAVGYSDHTLGIEVAIAAVALGATVIEKHFTLDRQLPGPDHKASLSPAEFVAMVRGIRNIEQALGDGVKRATSSELKNKPVARRSIVAGLPIKEGERFTAENLTAKRPGTGMSPMRWDEVVGRTATRDFRPDDPIVLY